MIEELIPQDILDLKAYSSARDEYTGDAKVFLDANEFPTGEFNRYPDPYQSELKKTLAGYYKVQPEQMILGNGSDEVIDIILRSVCNQGENILTLPPTYGMYQVSADINRLNVVEVPLDSDFQPQVSEILKQEAKVLFLCSPNNPSGNTLNPEAIEKLAVEFNGFVVIDEAYGEFADWSALSLLNTYKNVIVLRTLSKAWGMAGIRLGVGIADSSLIRIFNKVKPPYNVNALTQRYALEQIQKTDIKSRIALIKLERDKLVDALSQLKCVEKIYPSNANFLLVKFKDAQYYFDALRARGIIVRDRSRQPGCDSCLRLTVGTEEENKLLIETLQALQQ